MGETYRAEDVCRAAGIVRSTLNTWRERHFESLRGNSGGGWTRYTEPQALSICVFALLVRSGIALPLAKALVDGLLERGALASVDGKAEHALVYDISLNIDEPRKPSGPGYSVIWARSRAPLVRHAAKNGKAGDKVWLLIDLGALRRSATSKLQEKLTDPMGA